MRQTLTQTPTRTRFWIVAFAAAGLLLALTGCQSAGTGSSSDPFQASSYDSEYTIGATKSDGSPIASNANTGFNNPAGIAVHGSNFYVADSSNDRIQKFGLDGNFATNWTTGSNTEPKGAAVGNSATVYAAYFASNSIEGYTPAGGNATSPSGTSDTDSFERIAVGDNYIYVADSANHRILRYDFSLTSTHTLGDTTTGWDSGVLIQSAGDGDGEFDDPTGVAVDTQRGYLYVADRKNHRIQKFDLAGNFVTKWGQNGTAVADFVYPSGVAVDPNGNVYVADAGNNRIQKFDSTGNYITDFGSHGSGQGELIDPVDVALDSEGNVYVTENVVNHRVQKFSPVQ